MQPKKILNLLVKIGGVQYVVGRLSFNAGEFSYFFTYPSDSPEKQLNCDTGLPTPRLDHITWHNGKIHIKREDNVPVDAMNFNGDLLANPPTITPLYVESLYFQNKPCLIDIDNFDPWKGSVSQEILSLDTSNGFSLVFILVPSKDSTSNLLMGLQTADIHRELDRPLLLADLCDVRHRPGRILVWEGWDLLIIPTRYMQQTITQIPPELGPCRLPNYRNVPAVLTDLMYQAKKALLS